MAATKLSALIDEFTDHLVSAQSRTPQTAANYRHYLDRFLRVTKIQSPEQITADAVAQFRNWLQRGDGPRLKTPTANYHLTALRTFLKFLHQKNFSTLQPNDVTLQPTTPHAVSTLETPGLNRLLGLPLKLEGHAVLQHRDRAILELLGSGGLRVGEIARLQRDHVIASRGELAIPAPHGKLRTIPLTQQCRYWIAQYLKLRHDRAPQLFVRHDPAANRTDAGHPTALTPRSIQRLMKKYAHAAGLGSSVKPRTLRHTVATNLLAAGNDLETVRKRLGHATIASTKIYVRPKR
ncbi:MAG: tyrosine-type recombinase/integrase [Patescibacteria group bacterium]|nr:tyrosine-type recombinase/integrase [Patescibacteria group bacterium]